MRRYTFSASDYDSGGSFVNVSFIPDDPTWHELLPEFLTFLRGCGFVFDNDAKLCILDKDGVVQ